MQHLLRDVIRKEDVSLGKRKIFVLLERAFVTDWL
jgi:hypothetical protein